jgi:protein-disulfide isomerase
MSKAARNKAREAYHAQVAAEASRRKRMRLMWYGAAVVVVALLAAIIGVAINASKGSGGSTGTLVTPANLTAQGGIPVGKADAPVTVEIYLDYMCPVCGQFERINAGDLEKLVNDGKIKLNLYPIQVNDKVSNGTKYPTRAANAAYTVADKAPDKVWAFNQALFAKQPEENTGGLSDDEIAQLALGAGVPQAVVDTFKNKTFEPWVDKATQDSIGAGVQGTPTVKVNGKVVDNNQLFTAGGLVAAVDAAAGGAK